jgi:hypothetical protein
MKIIQNEKVRDLLSPMACDKRKVFLVVKETLALLTRAVEEERIDCDLWRGNAFGSWGI